MWIIFAILAAVVWGLDYVFAERIITKISVSSFLAIQLLFAFVVVAIAAYFSGSWQKDLATISGSRQLQLFFVFGILAFTAGNLFILNSIHGKNATLAGMIEISYPVFIALFAYLIFKERQLNSATVIGGLMIFVGVFVIYFFNK